MNFSSVASQLKVAEHQSVTDGNNKKIQELTLKTTDCLAANNTSWLTFRHHVKLAVEFFPNLGNG